MGLLTWLGLRRRNKWDPYTLLDQLLTSPLTFLVTRFYYVVLFLRGRPFHPPRNKPAIKVVCISDTHDKKVTIPPGDILIHAGDLTDSGTVEDIQKQLDWLKAQPHPVKVVIAGNHDSWFDDKSRIDVDVKSGAKPYLGGLKYLESGMSVEEIHGRKIHIFGVPDIPKIGPKAFAFQYDEAAQPWLSKVPLETDILITHCPPKHHRDLGLGDPHLLREVWRVKPRLHVFGHVHSGYGTEPVFFDDFQRSYERFLSQPKRGLLWEFVPNAQWVDAAKLVGHGVHSVLWKWIMGGPGSNHGGLMVNAAQTWQSSSKVKDRAIVVEL